MLSYLLEVGICWTLFYVLYYFLLRHETFFQLNRGFLLATLFLGLLIPLFDVPVLTSPLASTAITNYLEPVTVTVKSLEYTLDTVVVTSGTTHAFDWFSLLLIFYFVGVFIFGFRFLLGLNKIRQLYRRSEVEARTEYSLVKSSETHAPFSFFKLLFWSKKIELTEQEEKNNLRHELAHIREKHSFDIIPVADAPSAGPRSHPRACRLAETTRGGPSRASGAHS